MSVYVISGASRGLGFGFAKAVSENPKNLVVGLVRDKAATEKKVAAELGDRSNIHILYGDLSDRASLKQAAIDTAQIVGDRGIDYLIANGGYMPLYDQFDTIDKLAENAEETEAVTMKFMHTNLVGNIHFFHNFVPLVLKSKTKKVITITSGHADLDLINNYDIDNAALYAASKAALNVLVAKYSAQYKKDGVLFLSLSPGVVDTGGADQLTPEQMQAMMATGGKFAAYAPHFKGPVSTEEAVPQIISTWEKASIQDGFGGAFISHLGTKQWL